MNWAIESGDRTDYLEGSRAATALDAEECWRQITRLFFVPVKVRRTTDAEDRRLTPPIVSRRR